MKEDEKAPFTAHLEELRNRLIVCFSAVGVAFVGAYFFKEKLFEYLMKPLTDVMGADDKLIFTNLPEAFFVYLKTALLAGVLAATPAAQPDSESNRQEAIRLLEDSLRQRADQSKARELLDRLSSR